MNSVDDNRRAIIDRRAFAERMLGREVPSAVLAEALGAGRAEIARRLTDEPGRGRAAAQATAFLHDQIVRLAYEQAGGPPGGWPCRGRRWAAPGAAKWRRSATST